MFLSYKINITFLDRIWAIIFNKGFYKGIFNKVERSYWWGCHFLATP